MSAHTAGPWVFYLDVPAIGAGLGWHIVTNASRLRVIANIHITPGNAADLANARLITAAPDMLSALQRVIRDWVNPGDGGEFEDGEMPALDAARAAVAKATGGAA